MERYVIFTDWKMQHYKDVNSLHSDPQSQWNPNWQTASKMYTAKNQSNLKEQKGSRICIQYQGYRAPQIKTVGHKHNDYKKNRPKNRTLSPQADPHI